MGKYSAMYFNYYSVIYEKEIDGKKIKKSKRFKTDDSAIEFAREKYNEGYRVKINVSAFLDGWI